MTEGESGDLSFAREVVEAEIAALQGLLSRLGEGFERAVELVLNCRGRVVVTGIGKAGIIGQKISATLASTGTPSYSLHPVDAVHGDLGRVVEDDVVIALSNSGETEVVDLLPSIKRLDAGIIAVTGSPESRLAQHADAVLDIGPIKEACPLGLAPSASTTAMLAIGDALALVVAQRRNFNKEQYAFYHPGGELGRKLLKVDIPVMRGLEQCPCVTPDTSVTDALACITETPGRAPGAACVVDETGRLIGIFTDGDLRRYHVQGRDPELLNGPISELMIKDPKSIRLGSLATEAARILAKYKIDDLPVVDADGKLVGILDIQDLLEVRVIAP